MLSALKIFNSVYYCWLGVGALEAVGSCRRSIEDYDEKGPVRR